MEICIIYILNSALKHRSIIKSIYPDYTEAFYDPKTNKLYCSTDISKCDEIILVDNNVASSSTIFNTLQKLGLSRNKVKIAANIVSSFAKNLVDIILPFAEPRNVPIVFFVGPSGSGKSAFAKSLADTLGAHLIKWGKWLSRKYKDKLGKFGEGLSEIESKNPFRIPLEFVDDHEIAEVLNSDEIVIIDGVKTIEQIIAISYVSRRPPIVFFFELPEEERRSLIRARGMSDDSFDDKRSDYFKEGFERIKKNDKVILVDPTDWTEDSAYARALHWFFNMDPPKIAKNFVNLWLDDKFILLYYYKTSIKAKGIPEYSIPEEFMHTSYIQRIEKKFNVRLDEKQKRLIILTATAFRIIDDILDKNTVRNNKPAWWIIRGPFLAIKDAIMMTIDARRIAEELGLLEVFDWMFRITVEGVLKELEISSKQHSLDDWLEVSKKEWAFRAFLAHLIGREELAGLLAHQGIIAQAKDDLLGSRKRGREATEEFLGRPLFQKCREIQEIQLSSRRLLRILEDMKNTKVQIADPEEAPRMFKEMLLNLLS